MGNFLQKMNTGISKATGRTGLVLKKNSPEILLAMGVITFVGTIVMACRATSKADKVLEAHKERMDDYAEAKKLAADEEEYSEEDYILDCRNQQIKTGVELVKTYAPVVALGALSLTCFLTSRNILNKRYLGAVSAFNAVSEAFNTYRKRVRDEVGEAMDHHYRYGTELKELVTEQEDENGKKKKMKEMVSDESTKMRLPSDMAVFFDSSNPNWDQNGTLRLMFLKGQQAMLSDILRVRGHLFLNEVYDALGFPHTQAGAVVGWIMGMGDGYVDFGLYDENSESARKFINGESDAVLLDFNHDGIIFDKI